MAGSKKGDIEYIIRADDSNLEKDLDTADKKVKKALEKSADDTVKIEYEKNEKIAESSEKSAKKVAESAKDTGKAWEDATETAEKAVKELGDNLDDLQGTDIKIDADVSPAMNEINSLQTGDISINVDADTSKAESEIHAISEGKTVDINVDADVSQAETRIKGVSDDKSIKVKVDADTSDAEEAIKGLDDAAEKTGGNISKLLGNAFGAAKSSAGETLSAMGPLGGAVSGLTSGLSGTAVAAVGAGAAVVGISAAAVGVSKDIDKAMNQLQSSTGASAEETERYQKVLEDVYKNNYGEDFYDIADGISNITKNMGDMDDSSLQNVTESAFALRDTFEYDIQESTRAAKAMIDNFGINGEDAMNKIATGAQNGLDYSGEFLDSISEYSVQFSKLGFDADDMFGIFQKGAETGAFNLDKVGDAVKEFSIRAIDGSDSTKEGFDLLGLNADEMADKFSKGGESAKEAFQQTIEALSEMKDPIEQNTAGVDLFGTMWEDLGPEAVTALADIEESAYSTSDAMDQMKDIKYDDLGSSLEELKRNFELLLEPLGEALIPLINDFIQLLIPIAEAIMPIIEAISPLISMISDLVIPIIQVLLSVVTEVFSGMVKNIGDGISRITDTIKNFISLIMNVISGNWSAAWENLKNIIGNVFGGIGDVVKAPINFIIDLINGFIEGLNKIQVPDWVPDWMGGGKGINIPTIPRLKVGMDYVPNDDFPAYLHEGEAVLTKQENSIYRQLGGVQGMLSALAIPGLSSTVNNSTVLDVDYDKLAAIIRQAGGGDIILTMPNGDAVMRWIRTEDESYRIRTGGLGYFD